MTSPINCIAATKPGFAMAAVVLKWDLHVSDYRNVPNGVQSRPRVNTVALMILAWNKHPGLISLHCRDRYNLICRSCVELGYELLFSSRAKIIVFAGVQSKTLLSTKTGGEMYRDLLD